MKKILIIGTSGSGKSTLAKYLSELVQLPFFPSDNFYWESNWKTASSDKVRQQVKDVIYQKEWILDGNFDDEREFVWKQADCIIWLDYSFPTVLMQVLIRNFRWVVTRQPTWSGNKMTLKRAISGIQHTLKTYSLKKKVYPCWLAELSGIITYRFYTKQETERWLRGLSQ